MSDEAEKAANWDAVEELRKLKRHRDALTDEMARLGKALSDFSYVLQHRDQAHFDHRPDEIVVGREQRTVARITPEHLDWEKVSNLIEDYTETVRRLAELELRFRDLTGN